MELDFLNEPSESRLRKEIQNIIDSYSHPWDLLAELTQNSIDAIREHSRTYGEQQVQHSIHIEIDKGKRAIKVRDSGIGITFEDVSGLLAPHGTNKENQPELIGEKGVGLTYAIFMSNLYSLKSKTTEGIFKGKIDGASQWVRQINNSIPKFVVSDQEESESDPAQTFTEVEVRDIDGFDAEEGGLGSLTISDYEFLLRTKTAVGSTRKLFDELDVDVEITLRVVDIDGVGMDTKIEFGYFTPDELTPKTVDHSEYMEKAAPMSDAEKSRYLAGKAIRLKGSKEISGRLVKYYGFFAPSRRLYREMAEKLKLSNLSELGTVLQGGINISTKGMPTGVTLEPPQTGSVGYWPNFYILIQDDSLRFDVGRKSIPGRTQGKLKELVQEEIFDKIRRIIPFVTTDPEVVRIRDTASEMSEKYDEFDRLKKLPSLGIDIPFQKVPDAQEAGVVAIFHEMIAKGLIKGYFPLAAGHKKTYDLYALYNKGTENDPKMINIVIEFKYSADDILMDLTRDRKIMDMMDLIVCWDFDERKLARSAVTVEASDKDTRFYHGADYTLVWASTHDLGSSGQKPMIALKRLIDRMKS